MAALADPPSPPAAPAKRRWRFWLSLVAVLLLLAGAGLFGMRTYARVREDKIVEKAREFMEKKDYDQALVAAQRALQVSPRNVTANRIMAQLADVGGSPQAVLWHRSVAELEPGVAENFLKWADAGLRSGNVSSAEQALARMPDSGKRTAVYHEVAGRLAQASKKPDEAVKHFAEAIRLDPANAGFRFGLAAARLESSDIASHAAARAVVEEFRSDSDFRARAHRVLIQDHFRHNQWKEGFLLAAELQSRADAPFEDRMLLLDLLQRFNRPELHSYLMDVQTVAALRAEHAAALIGWLNRHTMALIAAHWSKSLPEEIRTRNPVPASITESYSRLKDWSHMKLLVADGDWEYLEFLRYAYSAQILREEGDAPGSRAQWSKAVRSAFSRPEALENLVRFAAECHWDTETNDLLWQIARGSDRPEWALAILLQQYTAKPNARGILNVSIRRIEIDPKDIVAQNNVAALSLLLNTNMERAQSLAKGAYEREPNSPGVICTYAYALHLLGETENALKLMASIDAGLLKNPTLATYYGVLLADGKSPEKALEYLSLAERGIILPEERELIAETRMRIQRRSREDGPNRTP